MIGGFALALACMATFNTQGLSFGFTSVSAGSATMIWWGSSFVLGLVAAMLLVPAYSREGKQQELMLTKDALILPEDKAEGFVRYDDIDEITVQEDGGVKSVHIEHLNGELSFVSTAMESPAAFRDFVETLRYHSRFSAAA